MPDPQLKAVYDYFGITRDDASYWVMRKSGDRLLVRQMSDDHIRNCLHVIFQNAGGVWPLPLKQYPSTATMLQELVDRDLLQPRFLMGTDWPWGDDIGGVTLAAARKHLSDFPSTAASETAMNPTNTDVRNTTWTKFKTMAAASGTAAKYGASYKMVRNLLDLYIKDWEPFLPEWATSDSSKAVAIWFFGTFVASSLEHDFFEDMPTGWVSSLAENAAYGAAGVLGADAFDVVWGLSGMLLGEVNKHLRGHGYEIDQEGNFRPATQLPDHDDTLAQLEMARLREEREAMRNDLSEMRAMLQALKANVPTTPMVRTA